MWNNNHQNGYGSRSPPPPFPGATPPGFPGAPSPGFPGGTPGFPSAPGYNPGYAPSYAPPGGYGAPPGPPSGYNAPPGPPSHGYGPPPGPPSGYGFPPGGPPGAGYTPPSGPPPGSFAPPSGPPPTNRGSYPGQQQQNSGGGYPGQQHRQQTSGGGYPGQQGGGGYQYAAPSGPPPPRPPTQQQNYGPTFEDSNHRQIQPFFQYSQCNGKKKALCVGINYFGQSGELAGCINDVTNIKNFLRTKFNYKEEDIVTLTDDASNPRQQPTRDNILMAMEWLVRGASPNDSLFFHYSGHGGQTKDLDGDEADGYDEVIYPLDYEANGHIVDDLMHDIMVRPLPAGCRLTVIFDSCHSGSALDLPYIYSTEGKIKEPNLAAEAGQGLLSAVTSYARGDMGGVFKSAMGIVKSATNTGKAEKISKATKTSPADCISWSGCKDSQTSADTSEAGEATGAMSYAFIAALNENPEQSYQSLLVNIRTILKAKYSQKPQLSCSHPMDTSIMFIC